jgi:hypothetical protein
MLGEIVDRLRRQTRADLRGCRAEGGATLLAAELLHPTGMSGVFRAWPADAGTPERSGLEQHAILTHSYTGNA